MILLRAVTRSFRDGERELVVLDHLNWEVKEGELVAIMGRSGSGKSTLLNVIAGLDRGYRGEVFIDKEPLHFLKDRDLTQFRNKNIGFIFQMFYLNDRLTVEENVLLPTWFGREKRDYRKKAIELLEKVGLKDKIRRYPGNLSGGEKQRVAIARALIMGPKLLLCDEPTGNLDEETGSEILELFKFFHREENLTIVIVTHEERTAEIAEKVFVLKGGKLRLERENGESNRGEVES